MGTLLILSSIPSENPNKCIDIENFAMQSPISSGGQQ